MYRLGLALLAFLGLTAQTLAQEPDARNIRFGWQASTPVTTFWAGFELKLFEAQGLKLTLTSFNDNAPELGALVAHQLDLAAVAPAPTLQAISFGAPLKIISSVEYAFTDKAGTHWSATNLIARKDAAI